MNINSVSQILQKEAGELIPEGVLIFSEPPDIGSPQQETFFLLVKMTVECEILEFYKFYLGISSQISEKFQGSTNITAMKLIFSEK